MTSSILRSEIRPVEWNGRFCTLIDQTILPGTYRTVTIQTSDQMAIAIRTMIVRGAPAIGVAAAFGVLLGCRETPGDLDYLAQVADKLLATRPTAVNLSWAVERMLRVARTEGADFERLEREAVAIYEEDLATCHAIGDHGFAALPETPHRLRLLTHCNAGALATAGYGTALGVIRSTWHAGRLDRVWADETRPRLQGARLTAWELVRDEIPVTVLADTMAGHCMARGLIDAVVVGADRIAANGDTANKIGTYAVAVLAQYHQIPFYVAAPWSTIDLSLTDGSLIPIEERSFEEVRSIDGTVLCADGVDYYNPAFDVTPAALIAGIITESGVFKPEDLRAAQPIR